MSLHLPELLCPAGDQNALKAAVDSGANAVYLGYKAFGARASAVNFDDEALERAVRYAHLHHVRVHVTVNTLVKPHELEGVYQALCAIDASGADAVIVQDLGVVSLVRQHFPHLQLHASTQMAICNVQGARTAKALGFDRVVLARECTMEDIRLACQSGIEIETFAHGALCTAVSGRCLMSSMSGGRSGNRGRCAQPCRQCFRMDAHEAPLLSLRDLCTLDDLPQLCASGVASLKIEGRLKSAEYVAVVTDVYRRALDEIALGRFHADPAEKEKLLQIFNRGGFTRGHAFHAEDADLVTPGRVSHDGLPIGEITGVRRDLAFMKVTRDLHDGDSLQLRGQKDEDMRYSGHDVPAGGTATLRLRPGLRVETGMPVGRLSDAQQLESARAHQPRPIPVNMLGCFTVGQPMRLSMTDGTVSVTAEGPIVQAAQNRASTAEDACRQLEKLGGTPFTLDENAVRAIVSDGAFLPVSALNALRRDAVSLLEEARIAYFALTARRAPFTLQAAPAVDSPVSADTLSVVFSDPSMAQELSVSGANLLIFEPRNWQDEALKADFSQLPDGCWLRLPPQTTQETLEKIADFVNHHAHRLGGVVLESVAQLQMPFPVPVIAGEGIPVTNAEGLALLSAYPLCAYTLWPEWNYDEQKDIPASLPRLLKVYGRERLMLLNHCPHRVKLGLASKRSECRLCKTESMVCGRENAVMTDRKGYRFPLMRTRFEEGCEITVLGALPTDLRAYDAQRKTLKAGALLVFTTESREEQLSITRQFSALLQTGTAAPSPVQTTAGHWVRGVD